MKGKLFSTRIRHFLHTPLLRRAVAALSIGVIAPSLGATLVSPVRLAVKMQQRASTARCSAVVLASVVPPAHVEDRLASPAAQRKGYVLVVHPTSRMDAKWTTLVVGRTLPPSSSARRKTNPKGSGGYLGPSSLHIRSPVLARLPRSSRLSALKHPDRHISPDLSCR
jgi:hypothetical protein